ncbi:MAG: cyclic-phosphate processing receiver domain-containing protein [Patescibacteria group bacterium]|nr:cyclic-phosphate processing receiver domain-containing protein [Patescibacteria group bacterium]
MQKEAKARIKIMKIWLDDQREAPQGWVHLHNIKEVEHFIKSVRRQKDFRIDTMSFDFHLSHPKRGIDVMKYLVELCSKNNSRKFWPRTVLYHSDDPKGVEIMQVFAMNFEKKMMPKYNKQEDKKSFFENLFKLKN